jgi:YfiH family protein
LSLRSPLLARHGFRHGFSLRAGGVSRGPFAELNLGRGVGDDASHVAENHALLARDVGYDVARLYEVSQVHGARVEEVHAEEAPELFRQREADALFCTAGPVPPGAASTARAASGLAIGSASAASGLAIGSASAGSGLAIGVRVADCVAILLAHAPSGAVAAVHAGWRGVVGEIVSATLSALAARVAAPPAQWIAAVFPHIGAGAFEVGEDVAQQIAESVPEEPRVILRGGEKPHVDLGLAVELQLRRAGLAGENIERVVGCTFSEPERFFSYRRDGAASGRHLAVIVSRC